MEIPHCSSRHKAVPIPMCMYTHISYPQMCIIFMYTHNHKPPHTHGYPRRHVQIYGHIQTHIHAHVHMHTWTHTDTHMNTHIHTCTPMFLHTGMHVYIANPHTRPSPLCTLPASCLRLAPVFASLPLPCLISSSPAHHGAHCILCGDDLDSGCVLLVAFCVLSASPEAQKAGSGSGAASQQVLRTDPENNRSANKRRRNCGLSVHFLSHSPRSLPFQGH